MPYSMLGSSPLSRGIRSRACWFAPVRGIIPALAGNTVAHSDGFATEGDHPRSRGEYPDGRREGRIHHGSSPLSRGIPHSSGSRKGTRRIIPALAGNTPPLWRTLSPTGDHPRSRGEYLRQTVGMVHGTGSSPLSRGIHILVRGNVLHPRIIPALAGNTCGHVRKRFGAPDHPRSRGEYSC